MLLEWFLTMRTAATAPRLSLFTLSLLKIRGFFKCSPIFASPFLKDQKRYRHTVFTIVNYIHRKAKFGIWAKSDENKIVKKRCKRKVHWSGWWIEFSYKFILSEPRNKNAQKSLKRNLFEWTKLPENLYWNIFSHFGELRKKWPKISQESWKSQFFAY